MHRTRLSRTSQKTTPSPLSFAATRLDKVAPHARPVREIMDSNPVTVAPETRWRTSWPRCGSTSCPGVPVVDSDGQLRGHRDRGGPRAAGQPRGPPHPALHKPVRRHGLPGVASRFEGRLRKAFAASGRDMMTREPDTVDPDTSVKRGRPADPRDGPQPAAGRGGRAPRGRRHTPGRARRPGGVSGRAGGRSHRPRRNRAQLRAASEAAVRVVKANAYGHGSVLCVRPRSRAGPAGSRWRRPARPRSCAGSASSARFS